MQEKDIQIPTMLTINQVAERTHLAPYFVRRLVIEGKVSFIMAGNKYLINFERFVDFLNADQDKKD